MDTLADRLRRAMALAQMNQTELAAACGVKPPSVNGWLSERAKFLRGENLLKAARALGVSETWLATGAGDMKPKAPGTNSEPVRLDPAIVRTVAQAMQIWGQRRGVRVDLTDRDQAEDFAAAYAEVFALRSTPAHEIAAGALVADLLAAREARNRDRERERTGPAGGVLGAPKRDKRKDA